MNPEQFIIESDMFDHVSRLHGVGHTCRVMALAWELGNREGLIAERNAAWCAAYIHDLARKHDGICRVHGQWAAETKLPLYRDFFIQHGLDNDALDSIYAAVYQHSLMDELDYGHSHYNTTALLKDADALDRIRLGPFDLNPEYLRFKHSRDLIKPAQKLFIKTTLLRKITPARCIDILKDILG